MAPRVMTVVRFIRRSAWRVGVSIVGFTLILAGVAMLVLPGPGVVVIILGLAVLATEYVWAATALEHTRKVAARGGNIAREGYRAARRKVSRPKAD